MTGGSEFMLLSTILSTRNAMSRRRATPEPERTPEKLGQDLPLDVEIANRLIREIVALKYPAGAWLREQEIAERFGQYESMQLTME
ncbi:MAG TPA: hypothetical protein PLB34_19235, partial [Rhodoblastus sp.]|nr:hypothetical protein [Rhodoblastus sp.]